MITVPFHLRFTARVIITEIVTTEEPNEIVSTEEPEDTMEVGTSDQLDIIT